MSLRPASEVYQPPSNHILHDEPINDHYSKWGYTIGYELDENGWPEPTGGNTAVFNISPLGMTEPVFVTMTDSDAHFRVSTLSGRGELTRVKGINKVEIIDLYPGVVVYIFPGEAYFYKNTDSQEDLVLHDVARPAFKNGDDVDLSLSMIDTEKPVELSGMKICIVPDRYDELSRVQLPELFFQLAGKAAITA